LVIGLHGGGGDAESLIRSAGWNDKADQEGFIVAYPNGAGPDLLGKLFGTWNAGACCGFAKANNIDDVGFISAVIDDLESHFTIDSARIYATGHSNGALMAYRLACELTNRIAAIAANAGQDAISCVPPRAISVLDVHGVLDPRVPFEGGHC